MDVNKALAAFKAKGWETAYFETKEEAADFIAASISGKSVGIGGCQTAEQLGLFERLSENNQVIWHWKQPADEARKAAMSADVYICSANGMSETGEIVNIDGAGNRVASTLFGHEELYIVAGVNKLMPDLDGAIWRARNVAAPKRAKSMNKNTPCTVKLDKCYDCCSPDRICRGMSILMQPMMGMKKSVIVLINEELGM